MTERLKNHGFTPAEQPGGWVSASPLPSPEELRSFYQELYYQSSQTPTYQASYSDLELRHKNLKCEALLQALRESGLRDRATFLDVGAGEGFLMNAADRVGLDVTGLDYSAFGVATFFPALQDRLLNGDVVPLLEQLAVEGRRFAACSAINVLEHVLDPVLLLGSMGRVLAPGGILAVTVPNDYSRLHQVLRDEKQIAGDFWFMPPQHLHFFNAENLPRFFVENGFEIIDGFADFPIDLYLLHPGSNYVAEPANGPAAHRARLVHDLMVARDGVHNYLQLYRAMFKAGIGRNVTVLARWAGGPK